MRTDLLGLRLCDAQELLREEGVCPSVTVTSAPRRREGESVLRVVYASEDGKCLTAAAFLEPLARTEQTQS